jgi:hypothetical protein
MASMVVIAAPPTLSMAVRRARGLAVDVHGASAALPDAAAEFGASHAEHIAQDPKQWNIAVGIDCSTLPVDFDLVGHGGLSNPQLALYTASPEQMRRSSEGLLPNAEWNICVPNGLTSFGRSALAGLMRN